jgi:hypothetical protein
MSAFERQTVDFVEWQELPVFHSPSWWDMPRWWLVRLLGGTCPLDTVKITRVPVSGKLFAERLFKQKRALVERFRCEPTTLLMGGEDYEELMTSPAVREQFTMYSEFNCGRRQVYGLTVKVIPWVRGIVVMP